MDYMNYYKWDCLVPKLYPGDQYVDWIMFNAYGSGGKANFVDNVTRFQKLLTSLDSPHLHAYMIFDSPGTHDQGGLRIRYDDAGKTDLAEQDSYRSFANHPKLTG